MPEERDLDWLADLDTLTLLHKDLSSVLAPVLSVQRWHTVLFRVMALLEWLKRSHQVMPASDTVCDDTFGDTGRDGALDNSRDRVHGTHDLGLELRRHVELDLLEEVF